MHHTVKALKKFHLHCCCIWGILVKTLTDPQYFSEGYFTETILFFPYHDTSCNFRRFDFYLEKSFIEIACIFLHKFRL